MISRLEGPSTYDKPIGSQEHTLPFAILSSSMRKRLVPCLTDKETEAQRSQAIYKS